MTRLIATLLFGVAPADPLTFVGVAAVFVLVAVWRAICPHVGPRASIPSLPCAPSNVRGMR